MWLVAGIALRGLLGFAEAAAYILQMAHPSAEPWAGWVPFAASFVSASSSFDTGSEWLLVLGSVLAVSDRGRRALEAVASSPRAGAGRFTAPGRSRPLTGAINRRALGDIFRDVQKSGALLLFFDLDGFKKINDDHGHAVGDACLKLFATALRNRSVRRSRGSLWRRRVPRRRQRTRPDGGTNARRRRDGRLLQYRGQEVWCGFSVGMSELNAGAGSRTPRCSSPIKTCIKPRTADRRQ